MFNNLTQKQLSDKSGVNYATIRKFENTGEISLSSLLKIAEALGEKQSFTEVFSKSVFIYDIEFDYDKKPKRFKTRKPYYLLKKYLKKNEETEANDFFAENLQKTLNEKLTCE
jgi:transcriptional regulator with XRE-family HTH domain